MNILGFCDSHEGHACIVRDGSLVAAMAEERLTRLKADMGYPRRSIESVLKISGLRSEDIDVVAVAGCSGNLFKAVYKHVALFEVRHWIEQNEKIWGPVLLQGKKFSHFEDFDLWRDLRDDIESDPYYPLIDLLKQAPQEEWMKIGQDFRRGVIRDHLGIAPEKIHFYRHEDCHKSYGFHSAPHRPERSLVFTVEGGGDDSSATISTVTSNGIEEHWKSNSVMLGRLYRYVTLILGMKPTQHEYKVMGLAPYGTEYHGRRSLEFFRKIDSVQNTEIINSRNLPDLYYSVRDGLEGERFDGIAWGLQTYLEEILYEWVANNVEQHGIRDVILSGGVAQNIKACKRLAELPSIGNFWTGPVSGDGSLGIGAAWLACREFAAALEIKGLQTVYLGTEAPRKEVNMALERHNIAGQFDVIEKPEAGAVASWLIEGRIVARYAGRMEFGQRALGNRSILADPRRHDSVERINQKVKYRDFWMPFTPSMTYEEAGRMLYNPKELYSPFMTMAFDLKSEFRDAIPAATHPADKSVRPQMLRREDNPSYYDVISAFQARTGVGAVLNTSFNLHGEAIVESPDDAISTFLRSEIDTLLFEDVAVSRRNLCAQT